MLSNVSWKEYLMFIGLSILIYYLFIIIKYYRGNLQELLPGKLLAQGSAYEKKEEAFHEELEAVVFDLRCAVLDQAGKNTSKQELLRQLGERLERYDGLRKPAYRAALNKGIIQHAEDSCGIVFSEAELNEAWVWYARG